MDLLLSIWTFAPDWKLKLLLLAMAAQMAFTIYLYLQMSKARITAGKAGRIKADMYKATDSEPEDLRVFTRAVANQFEMPVMFFALIVAGIAASMTSWITVVLAWIYVVLRIVHGREMITSNTVLKRRRLFIRTMQVFLLLLAEFVISTLFFAQA